MPRDPKEIIAKAIYDEKLKDALEPEFNGKAVVIDLESGDYEFDLFSSKALFRLIDRKPKADCWTLLIGPPAPHEIDALFPPDSTPDHLMPKNVGDIAQAIYDQLIKDKLAPDCAGKFITIDIQSGDYEIGDDNWETFTRLRDRRRRRPLTWTAKIGPDMSAEKHKYEPPEAETDEKTRSLGEAIFNEKIKPALELDCDNKMVAIDVKSGDYEIGDDDIQPILRLMERRPDAEIWEHCIGAPKRVVIKIPTITTLGRPLL